MKLYLLLIAFLFPLMLSAQTVSQSEAYLLAGKFMSSKTGKSSSLQLVNLPEKNLSHLYIFSDEINSSFVVISATRKAIPIIAYSNENSFESEMPDVVVGYFNWVETQLAAADESKNPISELVVAEWKALVESGQLPTYTKSVIAPLLTTTWDQGCYYNGMSPLAATGPCGRCYAGCVATAMGQVMKYHDYPQSGEGTNMYGTGSYSNLHVDFGAATYLWDSMPNALAQDNQYVAEFLYHCGVSVNMGFDPAGSGALTTDARNALVDHFRYAEYAFHSEKIMFPDIDWLALIESDLKCRRPILYRGFGSGGHAFVLDGMDNSNRVHFNWGWSGAYNGYFYVSNLNPGGADFTSDQAGIFGIEPREDDVQYCQQNVVFSAATDTITDGSANARYGNSSNCSWLIQPPGTGLIYIRFQEFATEKDIDAVYIYNGTSVSDPLVQMITGFEVPDEILVWGPSAYIVFQSDGMLRADGFELIYTASPVGIEEAWNNGKINVFPNPADEVMTVEIDPLILPSINKLELFSVSGQIVAVIENPSHSQSINVSDFPAGIYGLRLIGLNDSFVTVLEIQ